LAISTQIRQTVLVDTFTDGTLGPDVELLGPVADGGQPILGELYDVPMGPLNALLATEPTELELSIIELEGGELSFAMVLREAEHALGIHKDITSYGGWHAYRAAALSEAPDKRRPPL